MTDSPRRRSARLAAADGRPVAPAPVPQPAPRTTFAHQKALKNLFLAAFYSATALLAWRLAAFGVLCRARSLRRALPSAAFDVLPLLQALCFTTFSMGLSGWPIAGVPTTRAAGRFLGRWTFLTSQINLLGTVHFGLWCASPHWSPPAQLLPALMATFPCVFGLGCFLGPAYYVFDYFNKENVALRKPDHPLYHPLRHLTDHLKHAPSLPLVVVYALCIGRRPELQAHAPARSTALGILGVFLLFYILQTHVNYWATGAWPYPILGDITRRYGAGARHLLMVGLLAALGGLGKLGVWLSYP